MMKLLELLNKFNLDIDFSSDGYNIGGTDKNTCHSYIENFYEVEFEKYKDKEIDLLEIGIETGGSLKLWKEYFINSKSIIGVDILDDKVDPNYKNIPGVTLYFCDAYDKGNSNILGEFDIIIDDGPHTLNSQLDAIEIYLPKLKKDGLFIIEDIQNTNDFDILIERARQVSEKIDNDFEYIVECIDLRDKRGRWDDLIFLVRS